MKRSVATTILILMTIYGVATQFTQSAEWWNWGFVAAGVATVVTTFALATTGYFRRPGRNASSILGHAAKVCAAICMVFVVSYLVIGRAVPALGTLLLAPDVRLEATLERDGAGGVRRATGRQVAPALLMRRSRAAISSTDLLLGGNSTSVVATGIAHRSDEPLDS